jgi:ribonuclease III
LHLIKGFFKKSTPAETDLQDAIRNIFGYRPGNMAIYKLAFRHKSVASSLDNGHRHSNERLEYLGDAVLGSVVADYLFKKFPFKDEGFLTEMRSRIVSRTNLNNLSRKLGLDKLIEASKDNNMSGTSITGDAFEAFVGALYLDKGYPFAKTIIIDRVIQTHLDIEELLATEINFKSRIIEWAQKEKQKLCFQVVEEIENGKKSRLYRVNLIINDQLLGQGCHISIKRAEQLAAREAWEKITERGEPGELDELD